MCVAAALPQAHADVMTGLAAEVAALHVTAAALDADEGVWDVCMGTSAV